MTESHASGRMRRILGDSAIIQTGRLAQIILNTASFILLARSLGVTQYGTLSTIVAVLTATFALADLGFGQLALRAAAQNHPDLPRIMNSGSVIYTSATAVAIADVGAIWLLSHHDVPAILSVCGLAFSYLHSQARLNLEKCLWLGAMAFGRAVLVDVVASGCRLLGILFALLIRPPTLLAVSIGMGCGGLLALWLVVSWLRFPRRDITARLPVQHIANALPFGFTALSWNVFTEAPKLALAAAASATAVGYYTAAYRVFAIGFLPVQSVLNVLTPRLYIGARQTGSDDLYKSMIPAVVFSLVIAAGLAGCAPLLISILGRGYAPALNILRLLAASLPLQTVAFVAGDWLGGQDRQSSRLVVTVAAVAFGLPITIASAVHYGALGTSGAYVLMCATLAILSLWSALHPPSVSVNENTSRY